MSECRTYLESTHIQWVDGVDAPIFEVGCEETPRSAVIRELTESRILLGEWLRWIDLLRKIDDRCDYSSGSIESIDRTRATNAEVISGRRRAIHRRLTNEDIACAVKRDTEHATEIGHRPVRV